jgi:hypothetical protein
MATQTTSFPRPRQFFVAQTPEEQLRKDIAHTIEDHEAADLDYPVLIIADASAVEGRPTLRREIRRELTRAGWEVDDRTDPLTTRIVLLLSPQR